MFRKNIRTRLLLKSIIWLLPFLWSVFAFSQNNPEPVFRRYSVDEGLPSSTVYHVFQDSKGYVWFATANGVSRYDGYKFENFDLQSGLVDNEVFEIYEDYKHRIWFIPMSGKLCYFENGKIVSYKYNYKIKDHLPDSRGPIKGSFYVDSLDYIYLGLKQFGLISISPEGVYNIKTEDDKNLDFSAKELQNHQFLISYPKFNSYSNKIHIEGLYETADYSLHEQLGIIGRTHHHLFVLSSNDSCIITSASQYLFKIKKGIIEKYVSKLDLIWVSIDRDNRLWLGSQEGGTICFDNCDFSTKPTHSFLNEVQVTSVLQDRENAYWFSTLNDGVYYCSNINMYNLTTKNGLTDNRIGALEISKNGIYVGFEFGFVDYLSKNGIKHFKSNIKRTNNSFVKKIINDTINNNIWVCAIDNLYRIKNNQVIPYKQIISGNFLHARKIVMTKSKDYWVAGTRGILKINESDFLYNSGEKKDFGALVYDLVEDNEGVLWLCTINGLWKYCNNTYQYVNDNALLTQTLNCIIFNPMDSSLWMGSNGNGIVIKKNEKISKITFKEGLVSNSIQQLYQTKNEIWVATSQGLSRITLNKNKSYDIQNFTTANGLPTNSVTAVVELNNTVYAGTSKGLVVFDKNKIIEDKTPPKIIIESFKADNTTIDLNSSTITLNYNQNNLSFNFKGFVYRRAGNINYRHRIIGIDSTWTYTQTPNCLYVGLQSGNYRFEVEAQGYSGIWSTNPATVSFIITPPFWEKDWFMFLITMAFSLMIFFVFMVRTNSIKKRNDLLQNINLYKQQSLRQQMNPHFIFNTLNSIQLYILEKDTISSHKYLTKFARLMRMTLDNSQNSVIPLRDEIEALKLYLELEKLRFEGKFEYSIDYGTSDSILNNRIPTLLIQPFVENAIWHGISLKQNQVGQVKVNISENEDSLLCTVEDNGIGRKMAEQIKQQSHRDHKSKGSLITQQRIDLLNSLYKKRFRIDYEDLYDTLGIPSGTRVLVTIPKGISMNIQQ